MALNLKSDRLELEVKTSMSRTGRANLMAATKPAVVDRSWLTWVPARDTMGVISIAFGPGAGILGRHFRPGRSCRARRSFAR